jgi:uncharacterized alpha-E superfamily protein
LPWPELVRRRSEVACRTAENLFWLGRYCERTEFICRALRALLALELVRLQPQMPERHLGGQRRFGDRSDDEPTARATRT